MRFNAFDPKHWPRDPEGWARLLAGIPSSVARGFVSELAKTVRMGDVKTAQQEVVVLHPADQAQVLRVAPEAVSDLIAVDMTPDQVANIIDQGESHDVGSVIQHIPAKQLALALDRSRPERAAGALRLLDSGRTEEVLTLMLDSSDVRNSLAYPSHTVGAIMAPRFPRVLSTSSVQDALSHLHAANRHSPYRYSSTYVVNESRQLVGFANILELAMAPDDVLVESIAEPVLTTLVPNAERAVAVSTMSRYNLSQLAVVDEDGTFCGAIPQDYLATMAVEQGTAELERFASVTGDRLTGPMRTSVRARLPWLLVNLGTTFLAAATVGFFADTIAAVVVLAAFLPVVAGQGGIGGTQTMTLMVRAIALGEVTGLNPIRLVIREVGLGAVHGIALAIAVAGIAFVWQNNVGLALVLGLAMLGNMMIAGLVGAGIPLLLVKLRQDPAVSSAIVITTFTDVLGFLLFLGLATALIGLLT